MTIFLIKLSLCWAFFALLYTLLLRQETFFRANRVYLLGTAALGILLAALPGEQMPVPVLDGGVIVLPEFTVGIQQVEAATNTWQDVDLLWVIYWIGFSLMAARVLWGLLKIVQMAIRGKSERLEDGCLVVQTAEAKVPFSFFNWVFVPIAPQLPASSVENERALMLAHERAHAHGWHSADVLFAEILCIVFWFHPVAHWYRKALRTVHEYLADAAASRQADRKQYGLLLIGQSQSGMPIAFANHFFQSPLKQRLIMLTKKASAPVRAIKFGLVAPLAILFAMLFRQAPALAQVVDEKHLQFVRNLEARGWAEIDTVITFDPKTYEETVQIVRNSAAPQLDETGKLVYQYAEVQPQFPGGKEAMTKFLMDNIKYPELAKQKNKEGTVYILFVVDETGNLLHPRAKYYDESSRPLVEEAERVVGAMPKWTPAMHKGKVVRCSVNLPVKFTLTQPAAKELFEVDTLPEYPGGLQEMYNFLTKNVKYPEEAKKSGVEGMVVITFLVEGDGTLSNYDFANKSTGRQDFADEVIRVLKTMPNWKSAMKDGKAVRVKYTLPFKFKL
jgi:TonB family protein